MALPEASYKKTINAFTKQHWKPLLELIPLIEKNTNFGEMEGNKTLADGIYTFPYWVQAEVVNKFLEIVYKMPVIIDFDWGSWDEGREIVHENEFDYDTIDIVTKCKLITAIVRNDRFCDGALIEAFESGLMLKILKSIEKQVDSKLSG